MDTLLVPPNATFPVEKARYVCSQVWDGGPFLSYARRRGLMRAIPQNLRQYIRPSADNDEEFTGAIHPLSREVQEEFVQNWLFFGLLAEVFCLNEIGTGERVIDVDAARTEISALYQDFVENDNGSKYLTGKRMLLLQAPSLINTRLHLAGPNIKQRIQHLGDCLKFSCIFLNSPVHDDLDPGIKTSIAALGELISTGLVTATTFGRVPNAQVNFGYAWVGKYLADSGDTERRMLENGWCRSEVERVRSVNKGLGTLHYLSQMRKGGPRRIHRSCSRLGCVALQLDVETYRPSHAQEGCGCKPEFVDEPEVQRILRETTTFPVLRVESPLSSSAVSGAGHAALQIQVEPYAAGTPYVAISHVWADGMGNPTANALPACQIAKVARLVNELEQAVNSSTGTASSQNGYRLWIDPLLCPIEAEGKKIALERIPEVYRNATHVLVLDASLMEYAADTLSPAELLLRVFSSSAWMRRLWTLQEGALAQSLYFQFSDRPISLIDQMAKLFQKGITDPRYMRIWLDMTDETNHLRGWFGPVYSASKNTGSAGNTGNAGSSVRSLISLQRTLHYRTVSEPADEPICIATLMSLDLAYVLAADEAQERMVRVWELLARQLGGKLPARMLFSTDATLDVPGWRWAPRSLLGASHGTGDSMMDANFRMLRFRRFGLDDPDPGVESRGVEGVPTPWGLRVEMGGFTVRSVPLLPHLPLHPWGRVAGSREDMLMAKHVPSGRWLRLMDFYRSDRSKTWTSEEMRLYDRKMDNPLCRSIDDGRRAILYDQEAGDAGLNFSLLVQLEDGWDRGGGGRGRQTLIARRERMLIMEWASPAQSIVADGLQELAMRVAENDVTPQMLQGMDQVQDWDTGRETLSRIREYMKAAMAEMWKSDPAFVQAVYDTVGPDMEEFMWAAIQMRFSHNLVCEDIPRKQVWLID